MDCYDEPLLHKNKVARNWNQYLIDSNKFHRWIFMFFSSSVTHQMLARGKTSAANSWEGMTLDSLSSSKASSGAGTLPFHSRKTVNNAVRLIVHIRKPLMKDVICTEMWISMETSQCSNCVSHSLFIYENKLRNPPRGDANCYCESIAFRMAHY